MSRLSGRRPVLLPGVRRLWRDPHRLQLGTDPARAMILELTDPASARLLDLLDGTLTDAALIRAAGRQGIPVEDAGAMLAALSEAGLILDARLLTPGELAEPIRRRLDGEAAAIALRQPDDTDLPTRPRLGVAATLRRRLAAQVLITGASRLAVPIAATLASAGVGHLDPNVNGVARLADVTPAGLLPSDAHRPRGIAAAEAVRRAAPDVDLAPLGRQQATFAVLVGFSAPATLTALSYDTRRLAHLAVAVRDGTVVVGPLVRPGQSPCLNCLDLHRMDRDPAWPVVAAQLHTGPDAAEPLAATTALTAAAYAAAEVLTHIDGGLPVTLGATVEISGPGRAVRRRWTQHPRCGCRRRSRSRPAGPPASPT
jgi:bacteriocin biosynthesis cyclodehydratase domain-containing protein